MRIPIAITAAALVATTACNRHQEAVHAGAPEKPVVAVAKAARQDIARGLVLTAEFTPFQEIDVMAKVNGYIKQINVDIGDRVREGQALATLEIPEMADDRARAQASLDRNQSEVTRAGDDLRRAQSAHDIAHLAADRLAKVLTEKPGLVAQQEVDDARGRDLVAEAQVASARSAVAAAEQQVQVTRAELEKVNTLFKYTQITAPFTGVISKRYANTGSMQTQATPVVRLSQLDTLRLILPVPESAVPSVRLGAPVQVNVPSLNRKFPGKVTRFSDRINLETRTMETEVDVTNPGYVLKPGMYAEVDLNLESRTAALAVPVTAIDTSDAGATNVIAVDSAGKLERRTVKVGMETANRAEILDGLHDGDLVVIGSRAGLQPGEAVTPKLTSLSEQR